MKSGRNLRRVTDLALEGIAHRGGERYSSGYMRNLSSNHEVIMPAATESFKDSQAAACRDLSIFHPSSPDEEQKEACRICTWAAGMLSSAENPVEWRPCFGCNYCFIYYYYVVGS